MSREGAEAQVQAGLRLVSEALSGRQLSARTPNSLTASCSMNSNLNIARALRLSSLALAAGFLLTAQGQQSGADDHGNLPATASYFPVGPVLEASGLIDGDADLDVFAFHAGAGPVSLMVTTESTAAVRAELRTEAGELVTSSAGEVNVELVAGRYFLTVRAENEAARFGYSISGTVVAPETVAPVAAAKTSINAGVVTFDASQSFDLDGSIVGYAWNFGDGSSAQEAVTSHRYATAGSYTAVLTVTDQDGLVSSQSVAVTVNGSMVTANHAVNFAGASLPMTKLAQRHGVVADGYSVNVGEVGVVPEGAVAPTRRLLRVVESTLPMALAPSLQQHEADLRAEGWVVETIYTARRDPKLPMQHIELAQKEIWPRVRATTNLHIFFIGKVPMPRSGMNTLPDGHWDTKGAYATTAYYAMPYSGWTDVLDNSAVAVKPELINRPGDGKFDQDTAPGNRNSLGQELGGEALACVGFLDLSFGNAKTFGSTLSADDFLIERYQKYFARLHGYRTGAWAPRTKVAHMAYNNQPWTGIADWASSKVGANNYRFFGSVTANTTQPYSVDQCSSFGVLIDFKLIPSTGTTWTKRTNDWAVLDLYFGSYQIDFGSPRLVNPLLTGALATGSYTWDRWNLDGVFSGETLGEAWRKTVSNSVGNVYRVLYGDPTITLKP